MEGVVPGHHADPSAASPSYALLYSITGVTDVLFSSSKHILNAQVAIRAPCCKQWYDCAECHAESQDHRLRKTTEMAFMCKKCKKAFRKDMSNYEESDEYCPHCDNHYVRVSLSPHPHPLCFALLCFSFSWITALLPPVRDSLAALS